MPYITKDRREALFCNSATDYNNTVKHCGELNYMITELIKDYMETHGLKYQTINDIVGALEGAKMEFYRRIALPYEDIKITENGDVYGTRDSENAS